jgi:hypothetical protein
MVEVGGDRKFLVVGRPAKTFDLLLTFFSAEPCRTPRMSDKNKATANRDTHSVRRRSAEKIELNMVYHHSEESGSYDHFCRSPAAGLLAQNKWLIGRFLLPIC